MLPLHHLCIQWEWWELNPHHRGYEPRALPLSYTPPKTEVRFELTHKSFAGSPLKPLGYSAIWEP